MKLNIGCGLNILDGYINIDKVKTTPDTVVKDILNLDYPADSAEEIYLRHVIEHFLRKTSKSCCKAATGFCGRAANWSSKRRILSGLSKPGQPGFCPRNCSTRCCLALPPPCKPASANST